MTETEVSRILDLVEKYGDLAVVFSAIFGAVVLIIFVAIFVTILRQFWKNDDDFFNRPL